MKQEETLEEAIKREYETRKFNSDFPFDPQSFKLGAKWQQEQICTSELIQRIRVTKSDAEARRIIREQFKNK